MGQHAQEDLLLLDRPLARTQRRAETPLAPREHALGLPALAIEAPSATLPPPPEVTLHLPAVARLRPTPTGVAAVQGEQSQPDVLFLATPLVLMLPVIAAVPQQGVQRTALLGLPHGGAQLRGVLAGAFADVGGQVQVAVDFDDGRQFRPGKTFVPLALAPDEVAADVTGFQAGGVDGAPGPLGNQAACLGLADGGREEGIDPFFSSIRWRAFCSVE
jgi:hypothetical protein